MVSIFISYSHADKALAQAFAAQLEKRGFRVWIDEGELKIGDSLIERIATAIAEIDFFLALVSESSAQSNWCRKELALAVTGELGRESVKVLPVRVAGAEMPPALADVFYLELEAGNVPEVADKIAAAVPQHQAEEQARIAARQQAQRPRPARPTKPAASAAASETQMTGEAPEFAPIKIVGIVEEGVGRPGTTAHVAAPSTASRSASRGRPTGRGRGTSSRRGTTRRASRRCTGPVSPG